jgi:hypothetical protein
MPQLRGNEPILGLNITTHNPSRLTLRCALCVHCFLLVSRRADGLQVFFGKLKVEPGSAQTSNNDA